MGLVLRVFTCCFRGLKWLKPFFVFVPRLLFALSSCAGRGNVCVFRDAGVATAHCCGIGVLLTWLVSSEGLVARFVPDGLTLRAAGSWKNSLAVVVVSTSKRSTGTGAGGAAFHALQQRDRQHPYGDKEHLLTQGWLSAVTFRRASLWRVTLIPLARTRDRRPLSGVGK